MSERDQVVEILRKAISPPFKAVMGRGDGIVVVDGRPGYIWCRKLGKTEMLMQAYNRGAPDIEDVIVLVQESRIEGVKGYEVIGVASSTSPDNYFPEVPPHAWTHEWRPGIGRDRVTVYPRAWGYLRAEPIATGSMNVWVTPGWYYYNDLIRWYRGGYSPGFTGPPSGTWYQLLYFDPSDESLNLLNGDVGGYGLLNVVPASPDCTYPIAAIESTGTFASVTENMIEDVRLFMDPIEDCGETGTFAVHGHEDDDGGGQLDHGLAHIPASLLGDDHAWYLKERAFGGLGTEVPVHTHIAGQGGQLDWDDIWSDDIHDHSAPGEGGQVDVTDLTDSLGQLLTGPENTDLTDGGLTVLHEHGSMLITLTNRTGGQRTVNDVVVTHPSADDSFTGTAVQGYAGKVLVVAETIDNLATGALWERGGPFDVNVEGAVTWNDGLRTSGTPFWAEATASPTGTGVFAIALSASGGPTGDVSALFLDELGAPGDGVTIEIQEDDVKVTDVTILNFEGGGGKVVDKGGGKATVDITPGAGVDENQYGQNLVKNSPGQIVTDGAEPQWWDDTTDATITDEDTAGEGIADKHERCFKVVTTEDNEEGYQVLTFADEELLDAGQTVVSFGCWVYCTSANKASIAIMGVNLGLQESAQHSGGASWEWLTVENKTLHAADASISLYLTVDDGTAYYTMPMLVVNGTTQPWKPRAMMGRRRPLERGGNQILDLNPTGDVAFTTLDWTALTDPLATGVDVVFYIREPDGVLGSNSTICCMPVLQGGVDIGIDFAQVFVFNLSTYKSILPVMCDDSQGTRYSVGEMDADSDLRVRIWTSGYWMWE